MVCYLIGQILRKLMQRVFSVSNFSKLYILLLIFSSLLSS
jgi:hypothetical protein